MSTLGMPAGPPKAKAKPKKKPAAGGGGAVLGGPPAGAVLGGPPAAAVAAPAPAADAVESPSSNATAPPPAADAAPSDAPSTAAATAPAPAVAPAAGVTTLGGGTLLGVGVGTGAGAKKAKAKAKKKAATATPPAAGADGGEAAAPSADGAEAAAAAGAAPAAAAESSAGGKKKKADKKADKKTPGGLSKAAAERIRLIREEEERRRKEAEEQARLEEEQRLREEEEERQKLLRIAEKKKEKKLKEKEKAKAKAKAAEEERLRLQREQLMRQFNIRVDDNTRPSKPSMKPRNNQKRKPQTPPQGADAASSSEHQAASSSVAADGSSTGASPDTAAAASGTESGDDWESVAEVAVPVIQGATTAASDDSKAAPAPEAQAETQADVAASPPEAEPDSAERSALSSSSGSLSSSSSSVTSDSTTSIKAAAAAAPAPAAADGNEEPELRSPICCVLGHVDTGKTKLLDKIRRSNVQDHEAGGITQQIGATYFPLETVQELTKRLNKHLQLSYKVPGLLIIDTPGHESFTNLRRRGTSLCDIAILVVDIMHGIEPQTIESLQLLRQRKTPFIVALNKIDRLFDWKAMPGAPVKETLKKQSKHVIQQYEELVKQTIINFAEQGFNAVLYYENKDFKRNVALVPTSAITGEGIPDLLMLVVQLTQKMMSDRFVYLSDKFEATVLEVKVVEGLGTTIDVILTNGIIRDTDTIVLCGLNGPICTTIRALLTPQPLKEIRVKSPYIHHKEVKAAQGIKISAQGLEGAVPGGQLFIVGPEDDVEELKERVQQDLDQTLNNLRLDKDGRGVYVQASTLGSLEALLEFLKTSKIPVAGINIGPIHKKDVMKAAVMLERDPAYAVILGFNVEPTRDAREHATALGVQIFTAEIIYHLEDAFIKYLADVKAQKQAQAANDIVWPCILEIQPNCIFHTRDPITVGVRVLEGVLKIGTPLVVPSKENIYLGRCVSIEDNHVQKDSAGVGSLVAIAIQVDTFDMQRYAYGRHFDLTDKIYSRISRQTIDLLVENYRDELQANPDLKKLIVKLKKVFSIL